MADYVTLRAEWENVLERRASMRGPLGLWSAILDAWAEHPGKGTLPLAWTTQQCCERWERGIALGAETSPELDRDEIEALLGPLLERLAAAGPAEAEALQRFAAAWDRAEAGPASLLPGQGGSAALEGLPLAVPSSLIAFMAQIALRPTLEQFFGDVRALPEGLWMPGSCPWCAGPPAWSDVMEDGRRRLACHLCGGQWIAARLRCPFCRTWEAGDMIRLLAQEAEEGYFIEACRACRGYLKGIDRRQRWNAGSPLVEDWGSPHLDLVAAREGFGRPTASLVQLWARILDVPAPDLSWPPGERP
jgi:FdhE protein